MSCDYKLYANTDVGVVLQFEEGIDMGLVDDIIATIHSGQNIVICSLKDNTIQKVNDHFIMYIRKGQITHSGFYKLKFTLKSIDNRERGITACPEILRFN